MFLIFFFRLGELQTKRGGRKVIRVTLPFELQQGNDSVGAATGNKFALPIFFPTSKSEPRIYKMTSLLGTCKESLSSQSLSARVPVPLVIKPWQD